MCLTSVSVVGSMNHTSVLSVEAATIAVGSPPVVVA
jgi:hypothetical protein